MSSNMRLILLHHLEAVHIHIYVSWHENRGNSLFPTYKYGKRVEDFANKIQS